jgi:hypothetical protein
MSFDDAFARGVARAEAALADATTPTPIDTSWCRFGAGLECLNGPQCLNPNHRGTLAPGTTAALANAAVHNRRRRAASRAEGW